MKNLLFTMLIIGSVYSTATAANQYSAEKSNYKQTHPLRSEKRQSGAQTANYLNEDYANTAQDCGKSTTPAFLCTGVLLRGTDAFSTSFNAWDPSPASVSSGGVSFSYLRHDAKFNKLAYGYNNGFIFFPYFYAPDDQGIDTNIDIMCSFPIDAGTENRSNKGCGASNSYPTQSIPCQQQGIYDADGWFAHYEQGGGNAAYQCGFIVADESSYNVADAFYQTILSMQKISYDSFYEQNELILATWAQSKQDSLPIEAFFYLDGSADGKNSAQKNQQSFFNKTTNNIWVPVIKVTMPATVTLDATFTYNADDQLVPEPASLK